ncbi:dnaJ homolog subfamily C member 28-like [Haliotis cracherodii]|uniref:dnaJ homolog subfamily C member 28-like n=1 Tax=Haliotis cracherodii TaxID=6455 RepID=UPI0039E88796
MLRRSVPLPLCLYARLLKGQHWTLVNSSLHRQCNHGNVDTIIFCVSTKYVRHCQFSTSSGLGVGYKLKNNLSDCYSLLKISEDAALAEVREAYIKCAKLYHPDSGSTTADPKKFTQVKEAYKTILEQRKEDEDCEKEETEEDIDKIIFDIKHTAPQHRQYLSFEGIGSGTPIQRQRIYQQYRVAKATDNVHDYRVQRLANEEESAVVVKDKMEAKKVKISNAIERLVEDMITDSMNKGDFDNLALKGKPLVYENRNPLLDTDTHNLNKILINNGYAPEWITLQSEIRKDITDARKKLAVLRSRMGCPPFDSEDAKKWKSQTYKHRSIITDVNIKVDKFNMIVPFLDKQLVQYDADRDIRRIYDNWQKYLPDSPEDTEVIYDSNFRWHHSHYQVSHQKIDWAEVWSNIRAVFK